METFDLYGFTHSDLEAARSAIEQALEIKLEPHESFYIGDYYLGILSDGEELELRRNVDPLDGEPAEQEFPQIDVLLYISTDRTERSKELEQLLTARIRGLRLLRRKNI